MDRNLYKSIIDSTSVYYTTKLKEFGDTPRGVDWNSIEATRLRYEQLLRIVDTSAHFSINDLGCGWGYLYELLSDLGLNFTYSGFDISEDMIRHAEKRIAGSKMNCSFSVGGSLTIVSDYTVASGIFNVQQKIDNQSWQEYILYVLDDMNSHSKKGFSFNCLTNYSDKSYTKEYLYYADPLFLFDYCIKKYSRNVALLHDYGLYDFTVLVRKDYDN